MTTVNYGKLEEKVTKKVARARALIPEAPTIVQSAERELAVIQIELLAEILCALLRGEQRR